MPKKNFIITVGQTKKGHTFTGPVFDIKEERCRDCLISRIKAARNVPLEKLQFRQLSSMASEFDHKELQKLLRDRAAILRRENQLEHPLFVPLADCKCERSQRVGQMGAHLFEAVSDLFGLVRKVEEFKQNNGLTLVVAHGAKTTGTAGLPVLALGSATQRSFRHAKKLAIAEALERYSAAFWSKNQLWTKGRNGKFNILTKSKNKVFVEAETCDSGDRVFVPASQVFLPFKTDDEKELFNAAGLAIGKTQKSALERALGERVERDILEDIFSGRRQALFHQQEKKGALYFLGKDSGFKIWLATKFKPTTPFCVIGLGSSRNTEIAKRKAKQELQHVSAHMNLVAQSHWGTHLQMRKGLDQFILSLAFNRSAAKQWKLLLDEKPPKSLCLKKGGIAPRRAAINVTSPDLKAFGHFVYRVVTLNT